MKVLLGWSDINPNTRALGCLAPLRWAAWNGYEGVVEVLLGPSDVNPNELSGDGKTPLRHAAIAGQEGVVEILVGLAAPIPTKQITVAKHYSDGVVTNGSAGIVALPRHLPPCSRG